MSEWVDALPDEGLPPRPERRADYRLQRSLKARLASDPSTCLHLVNLSASGFRATGPERSGHDPFRLTIELNDFQGVTVLARLVWSRSLDYAELNDAGYAFVELGELERGRLLEFIRAEIANQSSHEVPEW